MSELKPCLVCNIQPEYRHYGEQCWNECPNCECQPWPMSDSYEEADDAWNKLQTPELPEGYKVQGTDLVCERLPHDLALIAFIRAGELVCSNIKREHWQAVAAFLQGAR